MDDDQAELMSKITLNMKMAVYWSGMDEYQQCILDLKHGCKDSHVSRIIYDNGDIDEKIYLNKERFIIIPDPKDAPCACLELMDDP